MNYEKMIDRERIDADGNIIPPLSFQVRMLGPKTDWDLFRSSGAAEAQIRMNENAIEHPDEHSPASVAYWAKRGMVKEFHGEDIPMDWDAYGKRTGFHYDTSRAFPQNLRMKWTSFVPQSAFLPENRDRKYPAILALHGGGNSVYAIDGWGFPQLAAEMEWIVIAPSVLVDDAILPVLEEAEHLYPIDPERIYLTGFSFGALSTNILTHQHPELFAAIAPCGGFFSDGVLAHSLIKQREMIQHAIHHYRPEPVCIMRRADGTITQPPAQKTKRPDYYEPDIPFNGPWRSVELGLTIPVITVNGNCDGDKHPICDSVSFKPMIDDINLFARLNDAPEITCDEVLSVRTSSTATREEQMLGFPFGREHTSSVILEGTRFDIGDYPSRDGITRIRIVCAENVPHIVTPGLSRLVMEFFSHFRRDQKTLESIYTP